MDFEDYLDDLGVLFVQGVVSGEDPDYLERLGGGLALASRDAEWIRVENDAALGLIDVRRAPEEIRRMARGRWREHRAGIMRRVERGEPPAQALEAYMRVRGTVPHTPAALERMIRIGQYAGGPIGVFEAPEWQGAIIRLRERFRRGANVQSDTFGSITALIYVFATADDWQNGTPAEWNEAIAAGEVAITAGQIAQAAAGTAAGRQNFRGQGRLSASSAPTTVVESRQIARPVSGQRLSSSQRGISAASRGTVPSRSTQPSPSQTTASVSSARGPGTRAAHNSSPSGAAGGSNPPPPSGALVTPTPIGSSPNPTSQRSLSQALRQLRAQMVGLADLGRTVQQRTRPHGEIQHRSRAMEGRRGLDRSARILDSLPRAIRSMGEAVGAQARGFLAAMNPFDMRSLTRTLWSFRHHLVAPLQQGGAGRPNRRAVLNAVVAVVAETFGRMMISNAQRARAIAQAGSSAGHGPVQEVRLRTVRPDADARRRFPEAGDPGLRVSIRGDNLHMHIYACVETKGGRAGTGPRAMRQQLEGMLHRLRNEPVRVEFPDGRVTVFQPEHVTLDPRLSITTIFVSDRRPPRFSPEWLQAHFPGGHFHGRLPLTRAQIRDVAAALVSAAAQAFRVPGEEGSVRRTQGERLRPNETRAVDQ